MKKKIVSSIAALTLASGLGCNSGGGKSTPPSNPCTGVSNCSTTAQEFTFTPEQFVNELISLANAGTISKSYANSTVVKDVSAQPGYFVIYDGGSNSFVALNKGWFLNNQSSENSNGTYNASANGVLSADAQAFAQNDGTYPLTANNNFYYNGGMVEITGLTKVGTDANGIQLFSGSNYNTTCTNFNLWIQSGCLSAYQNPGTMLYSSDAETKNADISLSEKRGKEIAAMANKLAQGLQMRDSRPALNILLVAERMKKIQDHRALTVMDTEAAYEQLAASLGTSIKEVVYATAQGKLGNDKPAHDLSKSIAENLKMPDNDLPLRIISAAYNVQFDGVSAPSSQ